MDVNSELVPLKFDKVMQSKAYTCVVLASEEKKFAIYTDMFSGKTMQMILTAKEKPRPPTHDFINMIFRGFEIKIRQVVINDLDDTVYFARIFLEQKMGDILHIVEIDARPSDCIALALMHKTPVYGTRTLLDKVVTINDE
jgi:bifunctional DNase/RNase